jgi:predicted GNAT family N-acyltransferase
MDREQNGLEEIKMTFKILPTADIRKLRHEVLWPHKTSFEECVIDPDEIETTFHMGAIEDNVVVGTSTFLIDINAKFETNSQYRLRAMATSPSVRGKQVGRQIIEASIEKLKKMNIDLLWCDARLEATGFYEKLGLQMKGEIYDVPNIGPHKLMYIELK